MLDVVFDMETQDPDDFLTLLFLLGHPAVRLRAVTITPGSSWQVGLVREALSWFGADIPVGAHQIDHPKTCVSYWHYRAYGEIPQSFDARPGGELLAEVCDEETTLITGAPLKNLGAALSFDHFELGRWVAQGGFAGEGVVPRDKQLEKFKGRRTCPTFNLNGAPKAALAALVDPRIGQRRFVSKNVCHGVIYDDAMHARLTPLRDSDRSLGLIWKGMEAYLNKRPGGTTRPVDEAIVADSITLVGVDGKMLGVVPLAEGLKRAREAGLSLVEMRRGEGNPPVCRIKEAPLPSDAPRKRGKKLHDPLAACCALDESIGVWAEVELFRERGEWGARLASGSGTFIIVDYDHERFFEVLTAAGRV